MKVRLARAPAGGTLPTEMHAVPLEETALCDAIVDGAAKVQLQFGWPVQGRDHCQIQQASGFAIELDWIARVAVLDGRYVLLIHTQY